VSPIEIRKGITADLYEVDFKGEGDVRFTVFVGDSGLLESWMLSEGGYGCVMEVGGKSVAFHIKTEHAADIVGPTLRQWADELENAPWRTNELRR